MCGTKGPGDTGMNNCGPLSRSPMSEGEIKDDNRMWGNQEQQCAQWRSGSMKV